jgi:hypothetical protein
MKETQELGEDLVAGGINLLLEGLLAYSAWNHHGFCGIILIQIIIIH